MKRKYEDCLSCPKFKRVFSALEGKWMYRCDELTFEEGIMSFTEIPCDDENLWNNKELPKKCQLYTERFVEDCNEEKV